MTVEMLIFIVLLALTCFNNGVQAYIHFEAYPLFPVVKQDNFASYAAEYERRLVFPLVVPYLATLVFNVAAIFVRPDDVSVIGIIVVLILNVAVASTTAVVATPVYNRIKENGPVGEDFAQLMKINLARLVISTAASLLLMILLLSLLT
jgi:hypothetical protein